MTKRPRILGARLPQCSEERVRNKRNKTEHTQRTSTFPYVWFCSVCSVLFLHRVEAHDVTQIEPQCAPFDTKAAACEGKHSAEVRRVATNPACKQSQAHRLSHRAQFSYFKTRFLAQPSYRFRSEEIPVVRYELPPARTEQPVPQRSNVGRFNRQPTAGPQHAGDFLQGAARTLKVFDRVIHHCGIEAVVFEMHCAESSAPTVEAAPARRQAARRIRLDACGFKTFPCGSQQFTRRRADFKQAAPSDIPPQIIDPLFGRKFAPRTLAFLYFRLNERKFSRPRRKPLHIRRRITAIRRRVLCAVLCLNVKEAASSAAHERPVEPLGGQYEVAFRAAAQVARCARMTGLGCPISQGAVFDLAESDDAASL